jgi:hypothetical protein
MNPSPFDGLTISHKSGGWTQGGNVRLVQLRLRIPHPYPGPPPEGEGNRHALCVISPPSRGRLGGGWGIYRSVPCVQRLHLWVKMSLMGEGEGGRRLREPLARRGVDKKAKSPLPLTLLDMVFYSALLSRKRSI